MRARKGDRADLPRGPRRSNRVASLRLGSTRGWPFLGGHRRFRRRVNSGAASRSQAWSARGGDPLVLTISTALMMMDGHHSGDSDGWLCRSGWRMTGWDHPEESPVLKRPSLGTAPVLNIDSSWSLNSRDFVCLKRNPQLHAARGTPSVFRTEIDYTLPGGAAGDRRTFRFRQRPGSTSGATVCPRLALPKGLYEAVRGLAKRRARAGQAALTSVQTVAGDRLPGTDNNGTRRGGPFVFLKGT